MFRWVAADLMRIDTELPGRLRHAAYRRLSLTLVRGTALA
jgi:hypothetical protein